MSPGLVRYGREKGERLRKKREESGRNQDKWGVGGSEGGRGVCLFVLFIVELLSEPAAHGRDERRSFAAAVL